MKRKIYLFRHGTTTDNANGVFSGWRDVGLNEKGKRDAEIVALRLKGTKIDVFFHSGMKRSKQTLNEVLKFHKGKREITEDERIKERSYGNLQGKTHLEIVKKFGPEKYDKWHRSYDVRPPGGESMRDVEKRVLSFIGYLLKMMGDDKVNVAISAHGNSMRAFRKCFEGLTISEMIGLYNDYEKVYEYEVSV